MPFFHTLQSNFEFTLLIYSYVHWLVFSYLRESQNNALRNFDNPAHHKHSDPQSSYERS